MAGTIETLFDAIAGPPDKQTAGPMAVLYAVLLGIISGFFVVIMLLARRQQSGDETKLARKAEALVQEQENLKLADNEAKRNAATTEIARLHTDIESHKAAIAEQDKKLSDLSEKLSTINSWSDLVIK